MAKLANPLYLLSSIFQFLNRLLLHLQYQGQARTDSSLIVRVLGLDESRLLAEESSALILVVISRIATVDLLGALLGGSGSRSALLALRSGLGLGRSVCVVPGQIQPRSLSKIQTH